MKIRAHVSRQGISFFAVAPMGDEVFLTSLPLGNIYVSSQRRNLVREIFHEGNEYDSIAFLKLWASLKRWRMPRYLYESIKQIVDSLRNSLKNGCERNGSH